MKSVLQIILLLLLSLLLISCRGNDSGSDDTTTPTTELEKPTVVTHKASLSVLYKSDAKIAEIEWSESSYQDPVGYIVEKRDITDDTRVITMATSESNNSWVELAKFSSGAGSYLYQDHVSTPSEYRVLSQSDNLHLSGANDSYEIQINPDLVSSIYFTADDINISMPLNRKVVVNSDIGSQDVSKVIYYLDTIKIGESSTSPNFPLSFDSSRYANGEHRLDHEVQLKNASSTIYNTAISTLNTNLSLSLSLARTTGIIPIVARASSKESIEGVKFYLDDREVAFIQEKNYCSNARWGCYDGNDSYMWKWDSTTYAPAEYTIRAEVSDTGGESLVQEKTHLLNNPPVLIVNSPVADSVVGDILTISGSVTDDQNDTNVIIKVGSQTIYSEKSNSFSATYDMSGLAEQIYSVTITAIDPDNKSTTIRRNVLYEATSNYSIYKTLGAESTLLTINNGYILYKNSNNLIRYNMASDTNSLFALGTIHYDRYYNINTAGAISFYGTELTFDSSIFAVESSITKIDDGYHPVQAGSNIAYISRYYSNMQIYDTSTDSKVTIDKPEDSSYWLNWSYYLNSNNLCGSIKMSSQDSDYDIFVYDKESDILSQVTQTPEIVERCLGLDGSRILYGEYNNNPNRLYYAPLNNLSNTNLISEDFSTAKSADGIIAWIQSNDLYVLKESQSTPTKVASNATLREVKDGVVSYTQDSKLYIYKDDISSRVWSSADAHYIDDGVLYIIRGSEKLVYRLNLILF